MSFEDARDFDRHLSRRFSALRAHQPPLVERVRVDELALAALVDDPSVRDLFVDAADAADFTQRLRAGLASVSGELDAHVAALARLGALSQQRVLLHGTGSWAFAGMLKDRAIIAGGDGLTGEVAMTNFIEPDVFVVEWRSSPSLYATVAFAYMNSAFDGAEMALWAPHYGRPPLAQFLMQLLFSEEPAASDPLRSRLERSYWRVRDPEADALTLEALERLLEQAKRRALPPDAATRERRLGPPSPELAENNVLAAALHLSDRDPQLDRGRSSRVETALLRYAPRLRGLLCCELPTDTEHDRARKRRFLESAQFPVLLGIDAAAIVARPDPSYSWSPERRVADRIALDHVRHVWAPEARREEVGADLHTGGWTHVEVLPLEDFELLRVLVEPPSPAGR